MLHDPDKPRQERRRLSMRVDPADVGPGGFPTPAEMRRWNLPAGAVIVAADATVIYPGGRAVTWGELRRGDAA